MSARRIDQTRTRDTHPDVRGDCTRTASEGYVEIDDREDRSEPTTPEATLATAAREAEALAVILHRKHFPEVKQWRPLSGDVRGLLSQIDNMVSGLVDPGAAFADDGSSDVARVDDDTTTFSPRLETALRATWDASAGTSEKDAAHEALRRAIRAEVGTARRAALDAALDRAGDGWRKPEQHPDLGRKVITLFGDGSGALMLWIYDGGMIDSDGEERGAWPPSCCDRWSYLPDDLEFHCELWAEDPIVLTLPAPPSTSTGDRP